MTHGDNAGRAVALLMVVGLLAAGCAGIDPKARKMLQQPADCASAAADSAYLVEQKQGGWWRFAQGLQGIAPPLVVLSLLRDLFIGKPYRSIYLDHWRVAFGRYNEKIDNRVAELESCGG